MRKRAVTLLWVVVGLALVFALGAYNKSISAGERGGFVMYYPAKGKEAGGPSARALTGTVVVPLGSQGFIKRLLQADTIEVASHTVINKGDSARRIRFEATGFPQDVEWHSRDRAWNPRTHEIERDLPPGSAVDLSLMVRLPDPLPSRAVPASGTITVVDARTGERLSALAVYFQQSGFPMTGGECCAPQ